MKRTEKDKNLINNKPSYLNTSYLKIIKQKALVILFSVFLLACTRNNSQTIDYKQVNKEYKEYKSFFNKKLVKHFPEEIDSNIIEDLESLYETSNYQSLVIVTRATIHNITNIKQKHNFIAQYKSSDTCLFVIKSLENLDHRNTELVNKISKTCNCKNKFPILNSEGLFFKNKEIYCKLQDGFTYYVIDAKPGKYLDDKYLKETNYMPEKWKHGYTRGFAISEEEKVIIYWIAIW